MPGRWHWTTDWATRHDFVAACTEDWKRLIAKALRAVARDVPNTELGGEGMVEFDGMLVHWRVLMVEVDLRATSLYAEGELSPNRMGVRQYAAKHPAQLIIGKRWPFCPTRH